MSVQHCITCPASDCCSLFPLYGSTWLVPNHRQQHRSRSFFAIFSVELGCAWFFFVTLVAIYSALWALLDSVEHSSWLRYRCISCFWPTTLLGYTGTDRCWCHNRKVLCKWTIALIYFFNGTCWLNAPISCRSLHPAVFPWWIITMDIFTKRLCEFLFKKDGRGKILICKPPHTSQRLSTSDRYNNEWAWVNTQWIINYLFHSRPTLLTQVMVWVTVIKI